MFVFRKKKIAISLILIALGNILFVNGVIWLIEPNIDATSRLKAKGIVSEIINETVKEEFDQFNHTEDLFILTYGDDKHVQMVQTNTALINQLIAELTVSLQEKYRQLSPQKLTVPIGSAFGSALLSQSKRGFTISVLPLSVVSSEFETGFESQGINQTKYKLYAVIQSSVRVLQPFSEEHLDITTKILLSEVVIVGEVPENYVHVPKEDILDVT